MKKNRSVRAIILTSIVSVLPVSAFAAPTQITDGFKGIKEIVDSFTKNVVTSLTTLFATAALVAFFYGIVQYIWGVRGGDSKKITDGNKFMVWGLVALFVMFSVWGIITFAQGIFGIQDKRTIVIPEIILDRDPSRTTNTAGGAFPVSGNNQQPTATLPTNCTNLADGVSCRTISGETGKCGTPEEGIRGCYREPCPVGYVRGDNGCQPPRGVN